MLWCEKCDRVVKTNKETVVEGAVISVVIECNTCGTVLSSYRLIGSLESNDCEDYRFPT